MDGNVPAALSLVRPIDLRVEWDDPTVIYLVQFRMTLRDHTLRFPFPRQPSRMQNENKTYSFRFLTDRCTALVRKKQKCSQKNQKCSQKNLKKCILRKIKLYFTESQKTASWWKPMLHNILNKVKIHLESLRKVKTAPWEFS